jgi:hypothetical protein
MARRKSPEEREKMMSILQMPANSGIPDRIIKIIQYTNLSYRGLLEKWLHQEETSIESAKLAEKEILRQIGARLDVLEKQVLRLEGKRVRNEDPSMAAFKKSLVYQILAMRKAGKTYRQIADLFNGEGTRTLSGRGQWSAATVMSLLKTKKPGRRVKM